MTEDHSDPRWDRPDAATRRRFSSRAVPKRTGVSQATLDIEAETLAYCRAHNHRIRGGTSNPQGCRPDLQDALMGRLGQRSSLPELPPSGVDPVTRMLDAILADFGEHDLDTLLADVNTQREAQGQKRYTMTAISIRLRELRGHGRTLNHRATDGQHGSDTYWYERPPEAV